MSQKRICGILESCLLTEEEMSGPWKDAPNPWGEAPAEEMEEAKSGEETIKRDPETPYLSLFMHMFSFRIEIRRNIFTCFEDTSHSLYEHSESQDFRWYPRNQRLVYRAQRDCAIRPQYVFGLIARSAI